MVLPTDLARAVRARPWPCLKAAVVVVLAELTSGCFVVPLPHTSPHGYDFRGQIVDARTHHPLPGAKVLVEGCPGKAALTGADGLYAVSSGSYFHLLYYANPSWSAGIPQIGEYRTVLRVEKSGYRPFRLDFGGDRRMYKAFTRSEEYDDIPDRRLSRKTFVLNPIPLSAVAKP